MAIAGRIRLPARRACVHAGVRARTVAPAGSCIGRAVLPAGPRPAGIGQSLARQPRGICGSAGRTCSACAGRFPTGCADAAADGRGGSHGRRAHAGGMEHERTIGPGVGHGCGGGDVDHAVVAGRQLQVAGRAHAARTVEAGEHHRRGASAVTVQVVDHDAVVQLPDFGAFGGLARGVVIEPEHIARAYGQPFGAGTNGSTRDITLGGTGFDNESHGSWKSKRKMKTRTQAERKRTSPVTHPGSRRRGRGHARRLRGYYGPAPAGNARRSHACPVAGHVGVPFSGPCGCRPSACVDRWSVCCFLATDPDVNAPCAVLCHFWHVFSVRFSDFPAGGPASVSDRARAACSGGSQPQCAVYLSPSPANPIPWRSCCSVRCCVLLPCALVPLCPVPCALCPVLRDCAHHAKKPAAGGHVIPR